jgi:hypothetical protein
MVASCNKNGARAEEPGRGSMLFNLGNALKNWDSSSKKAILKVSTKQLHWKPALFYPEPFHAACFC